MADVLKFWLVTNVEDSDHILVRCYIATITRKWILRWCGISDHHFAHSCELHDFAASWGLCPKKRKLFLTICYGMF